MAIFFSRVSFFLSIFSLVYLAYYQGFLSFTVSFLMSILVLDFVIAVMHYHADSFGIKSKSLNDFFLTKNKSELSDFSSLKKSYKKQVSKKIFDLIIYVNSRRKKNKRLKAEMHKRKKVFFV